jgi:hypothetical protein
MARSNQYFDVKENGIMYLKFKRKDKLFVLMIVQIRIKLLFLGMKHSKMIHQYAVQQL